jgi:Ca2+-binding RTX toxin-like protein
VNIDKIHIDDAVFTAFASGALTQLHTGSSASGPGAQIVYNSATGALYYDQDGAGGANQTQFATLDVGLTLDADDFWVV